MYSSASLMSVATERQHSGYLTETEDLAVHLFRSAPCGLPQLEDQAHAGRNHAMDDLLLWRISSWGRFDSTLASSRSPSFPEGNYSGAFYERQLSILLRLASCLGLAGSGLSGVRHYVKL